MKKVGGNGGGGEKRGKKSRLWGGETGEKEERFLSGDIGVKIGRNDLGRQKNIFSFPESLLLRNQEIK